MSETVTICPRVLKEISDELHYKQLVLGKDSEFANVLEQTIEVFDFILRHRPTDISYED